MSGDGEVWIGISVDAPATWVCVWDKRRRLEFLRGEYVDLRSGGPFWLRMVRTFSSCYKQGPRTEAEALLINVLKRSEIVVSNYGGKKKKGERLFA